VRAEEVFRALVALPREAGTPDSRAARTLLRRYLEELGFEVREEPFTFQPVSLLVLPLLGAGLGWLTVLEVPLLMLASLPGLAALAVWLAGLVALAALAWGLGTGVAVPGAETRSDANLIATPRGGSVRRWVVAHLDTKAQGHSMAGRLTAIWLLAAAAGGLSLSAVLRARAGPRSAIEVAGVAGLAIAAGALAGRGTLRGHSPGARDNGTGVLAALVAAEEGPGAAGDAGFLFTGAEEFGLIGARRFIRAGQVGEAEVVNLDTITDRGQLHVVLHDEGARSFAGRVAGALGAAREPVRIRRLPLGILVDSLPFARAGVAAVTVARLDWQDLRRLHTPRDDLDGLGLETAFEVGRAVAGLR